MNNEMKGIIKLHWLSSPEVKKEFQETVAETEERKCRENEGEGAVREMRVETNGEIL